MGQTTRRPRLDEDAKEVLRLLADAPNGLSGIGIQQKSKAWPVRPTIDSLTRRELIKHDGYREVAYRQYEITGAGREAIS